MSPGSRPDTAPRHSGGFTYVELLTALVISAVVFLGIQDLIHRSTQALDTVTDEAWVNSEAQWAMQRVLRAIRRSRVLFLPTPDKPGTLLIDESVRELVALSQDPEIDRDNDGFGDPDDDRDGRVDEDLGDDIQSDGEPGIKDIDDNKDLLTDSPSAFPMDDDESGTLILPDNDEDPINGVDDDGDGLIDEDPGADMNGDGFPGIEGVDDDGDGDTDEGDVEDDDEDGAKNEDPYNVVVFRKSGSLLLERTPKIRGPHDQYTERTLLDNVSLFQVEWVPVAGGRSTLLEVTLQVTTPDGETITLNSRVRVGSEVGG